MSYYNSGGVGDNTPMTYTRTIVMLCLWDPTLIYAWEAWPDVLLDGQSGPGAHCVETLLHLDEVKGSSIL